MAQLASKFSAQDHDTTQNDFTPLPLGVYKMEVTASDVGPTKAGSGTILKVTYEIIEPEQYAKRRFFGQMNIENANPTAQQIGQKELASLCRAIGISEIDDSEALHFHPFVAKVGLEKPQEGYAQKNKVVRFYFPDEGDLPEPAIDANQPAQAARPANDNRQPANQNRPAPAAARPAAAAGARPWGKK